MGPGVAVAEVRNAVRDCLADLTAGDLVLVACSGGADSLALAAAAAFVAPRLSLRVGGVTVDHGLQPGSGERAVNVAALLGQLGLDPVRNVAVTVAPAGSAAGPEAAARTARYHALDAAARDYDAAAVLLGHTLDDQAETVLLGLARGSGARSLAGMPARRGPYRRPLLTVRRAATLAACAELGLEPWQDPHNHDFRYARARVRHQALPALEAALGPGVAEALARTASQLRADAECLDGLAFAEGGQLRGDGPDPADAGPADAGPARALANAGPGPADAGPAGALVDAGPGPGPADAGPAGLEAGRLLALPAAIRTRVLRDAALIAGCPHGALTAGHIDRVDALVTCWRGQRWVDLPGGVRARRRDGKVWFSSTGPDEGGESVGRK
jgi:tRNA(Ile)-lysidine synthase